MDNPPKASALRPVDAGQDSRTTDIDLKFLVTGDKKDMTMLTLEDEYLKLGKRNHRPDTSKAARRVVEKRVLLFLNFCGIRGVHGLDGIRQEHYAAFIRDLATRRRSGWTIYKYQLAIRGMVRRRGLRIRIDACLPRQKGNRRKRIMIALDTVSGLSTDQRRWILRALDGVI